MPSSSISSPGPELVPRPCPLSALRWRPTSVWLTCPTRYSCGYVSFKITTTQFCSSFRQGVCVMSEWTYFSLYSPKSVCVTYSLSFYFLLPCPNWSLFVFSSHLGRTTLMGSFRRRERCRGSNITRRKWVARISSSTSWRRGWVWASTRVWRRRRRPCLMPSPKWSRNIFTGERTLTFQLHFFKSKVKVLIFFYVPS